MNAHLEKLKVVIRDAWLTLAALPDPDARFRRAFGAGFVMRIVQDARDAYGATPASWRGTPSAHEISVMEVVLDWLCWLRRVEDEYSIRRIAAWSLGVAVWKMAQRERCSERTIQNRIDRSVAKILGEFHGGNVEVEAIEEPEPHPARIRGFTPPPERPKSGPLEDAGKVYIAGIGLMFRGQSCRSACDVAEDTLEKNRR